MNIAVVSPGCMGVGVTSLAILLGIDLVNRGNPVVVTSLRDGRNDLREYVGSIPNDLGDMENGMREMLRAKAAGEFAASDIRSYCVDQGVDILLRSEGMKPNEVDEIIQFISGSSLNGRGYICVVDVDVDDMRRPEVEMEITAADVVVVVLTQNISHVKKFRDNRANMAKAFANKKVVVVINKYDKFAGTVKDVWNTAGVKYGDGWIEIRYNKCVPLMTTKCFIAQAAEAMKAANDADIATLKADIGRVGGLVEKRR